jgi:hypothetical protein
MNGLAVAGSPGGNGRTATFIDSAPGLLTAQPRQTRATATRNKDKLWRFGTELLV